MGRLTVLGLDPSLNNFGMALAELDTDTSEIDMKHLFLTQAPPAKDKKQVRKNCQDLDRCIVQNRFLSGLIESKEVNLIFCEMPVGSQSARAMASYGMCLGIISAVKVPIIQLTPADVKIAAVNNRTASKNDMIEWAFSKYPHKDWLVRAGKPIAKNEHIADAIACIEAGIKTDEYQKLIMMSRSMSG